MNRLRQIAVVATALVCGASARADAVLDWNEVMMSALAGQNPLNETRLAAITHLAMFEAVNAITREYRPYLRRSAIDAPSVASPDAAAVAAAHRVLSAYAPQHAAMLDNARATSLAVILDGAAKDNGVAVGESAAAAVLAMRANDGSTPPQSYLPTTSEPGEWQLTPGCPATGGVLAHWGNVTPFGLDRAERFSIEPPPPLTSIRYARAFNETKRVGDVNSTQRSQYQSDVARFYAAVLPVRAWNPAVAQIARSQNRSLTHTARALALLNMAMSDALVTMFKAKYEYTFWRPITAIRAGDTDGNWGTTADPEFTPYVGTPCHPGYGSTHASSAYAARAVLERIYGRRGHAIELADGSVPDVRLQYQSFEQITDDIDTARIYGGIHFRFDQEAGAQLGNRVGTHVVRRNLRCVQPFKWHPEATECHLGQR